MPEFEIRKTVPKELREEFLRKAEAVSPGRKYRGYTAAVDVTGPNLDRVQPKLIHWTNAAFHGTGPTATQKRNPKVWDPVEVPQEMVARMNDGLPPVVRRTAQQRYQALVQDLMAMGRDASKGRGYPVWPESIAKILDANGIKRGDTDLHKQVYALARHFIVKGENAQRLMDSKKVVLDWHGHFA